MLPDDPNDPDALASLPPFDAESFRGVARLFPLPGVALFPRVLQPLHLFEERYLALMEDALQGDGLIAVAVLRPGWESDYPGRPPLEGVACLGRIVTHHRLPNGRFNLLLAGERRLRLGDELAPPQAFREAYAELVPEVEPDRAAGASVALRERLEALVRGLAPEGRFAKALSELLEQEPSLGVLADLAAHALPAPHAVKLAALAEPDASKRAAMICGAIEAILSIDPRSQDPPPGRFPPMFGPN